jgi:hypothetical protein
MPLARWILSHTGRGKLPRNRLRIVRGQTITNQGLDWPKPAIRNAANDPGLPISGNSWADQPA